MASKSPRWREKDKSDKHKKISRALRSAHYPVQRSDVPLFTPIFQNQIIWWPTSDRILNQRNRLVGGNVDHLLPHLIASLLHRKCWKWWSTPAETTPFLKLSDNQSLDLFAREPPGETTLRHLGLLGLSIQLQVGKQPSAFLFSDCFEYPSNT